MPVEIESVIGMLNDMNKTMKQKIEDFANQSAGKIYDEMYKRLKDAALKKFEHDRRRLKGLVELKRINQSQEPIFRELLNIISFREHKLSRNDKVFRPHHIVFNYKLRDIDIKDQNKLIKILKELYVSLGRLHDEYFKGFLSEWNKLDYLFPGGLTQYNENPRKDQGYHMDIEDFLTRLRDYNLPLVYSRCHFFCIAYRKMIKELSGDAGLGIENRSFAYDRDDFITFFDRRYFAFEKSWVNFIYLKPETGQKSPFTPVKVVMNQQTPEETPEFNEKKAFLLFQCKLFAQRLELDPIIFEDEDYRLNKEKVKVFNCDDICVSVYEQKPESGKVTELVTKLRY